VSSVRVRRNEGVATPIDPRPRAGIREDIGEASAGERIDQPLSRESDKSQGADEVTYSEGNTDGHILGDLQYWRWTSSIISTTLCY
jgi:hypothetical protein